MRFRFCGDLDCPDWVLAEIQTLSKLSSVKFKLLCNQVTTCILQDGSDLNVEKIEKLCADAKFDWSDSKSAIACLHFVLTSGAKHVVAVDELLDEVQQLGLPKEHAAALGKVFGDNTTSIRTRLTGQSLKLNSLEKVDWRVDYVMSTNQEVEVIRPEVHLRLDVKDAETKRLVPVGFALGVEQCRLLLKELKEAEKVMSLAEGN